MNGVGELVRALISVEEQLARVGAELGRGRTALDEAVAALARIDPDHPETAVPPGLHRADDQIERTSQAVERVRETIAAFRSSL
ncbi:hypothetical protein [Salinifilum ghardaiensis]